MPPEESVLAGAAAAIDTQGPGAATLRRTLTYYDLLAYGLAYVSPFAPLATIGYVWRASDGLLVLAYLFGALCMYFTAQSYATMTEVVPNAGSVYGFARHALGPLPGFLAGWMILLDYLLIPAYIYVVISVAMGTLVPQVDRAVWITSLALVTLAINWFGIAVTSRVNVFSVVVQIGFLFVLLGFSVVALHSGKGNAALTLHPLFEPQAFHWRSMFTATSICVMSFLGFDAVSTLAEEVKDNDRRIVGRAIVGVLILAAALFVSVAWVLGNLLAGFRIRDPAAASYELVAWSIGAWASMALAWLSAALVGFTNALPMQAGVARVLYAMGRDAQLPRLFGRLHPRFGTPYVGMLVSTALSLAVALAMRFHMGELVSMVNFGALTGFLLLHVSVLRLFWFKARSDRWFVHLFVPVAGILVVLAVMSGLSVLAKTLGMIWLAFGAAYGVGLRRANRDTLTV